jgi:hypothetical protein
LLDIGFGHGAMHLKISLNKRSSCIENMSFFAQNAKFRGVFFKNKQSAVSRFPCFAFSFFPYGAPIPLVLLFVLCLYAKQGKTIRRFSLLEGWRCPQVHPTLPKSAGCHGAPYYILY